MTFHVGATANGSSRRYGINVTSDRAFMVADINPQNYYANAHSYLDEPLKQLVKLIPELKRIRLELNQQMLPVIIEKTGITVDDFFHNVPSLIADEEVTQQRVTSSIGALNAKQHVRDNYLILVRGDKNSAHLDEFRMDPKGNRVEQLRTDKQDYVVPSQFFVTSGFALSCIYFATALQSESTFRYLGEESIGKQDTYVVGFAQRPAEAATT